MKLNEDQTLHFVSLYREHACLWDIKSDFYKNRDMRLSALQKIREEMQIEGYTEEDVKNKIKKNEYKQKQSVRVACGDDSGVQTDGFLSLESKVDKLNEICCEQTRVLAELAAQVRGRSGDEPATVLAELLNELAEEREKTGEGGARSFLSAIEARPSLERRVGDAITDLLQSEDLKQRIVSSTTSSIKELIKNLFSAEVTALYVPLLERAHCQLLKHVTKMVATAFADLEENTACNAEDLRQTSQSLQAALHRHETLLRQACVGGRLTDVVAATTEKVIQRELKQWREEISNCMVEYESDSGRESPRCASPTPSVAPSEPRTTGLTDIDRIMTIAEVELLIRNGDVNAAFTAALLAADLTVVAAACRAAPAAGRPALAQPVLLSLLQQLPVDLLQDTTLKCINIQYALQTLNPADPVTRAHLPFVAGELHRHLTAFLHQYPHHTLAPRIADIIDTARSLV